MANIRLVKLLLEHGANKEATDKKGQTALHHVIQGGNLPLMQLLIKEGANIEALDGRRWTSLIHAVSNSGLLSMELLLDHGANPNARDSRDITPLHYAVIRGDIRMVEVLLKHGADPCAEALSGVERILRSVTGGGGNMPRGFNEPHWSEYPDPKRAEIESVLKEAEKAWKASGGRTSR